jgi:hypothetical protein
MVRRAIRKVCKLRKSWEDELVDTICGAMERPAPAAIPEGLREKSRKMLLDYFDCLGDTEEEKQLRIRWVREMKAENAELRAQLAALRAKEEPEPEPEPEPGGRGRGMMAGRKAVKT